MICVIQARMSSSRFPKKMMAKILGKTIIERVVNQVSKSKYIEKIIVVTSKLKSDQPIVDFCKKNTASEVNRGNSRLHQYRAGPHVRAYASMSGKFYY